MNGMTIVWLVVTAICLLVEFITPSALVSIWFVVGGIVALLLSLFNCMTMIQIIVFVVVSIASIIILRPIATRYVQVNKVATNADRIIGEEAVVLKAISKDEWGQVKVFGSVWSAISVDEMFIDKNERVKIIAIDGAKLIVKKKK